jgi:hypothetical protein
MTPATTRKTLRSLAFRKAKARRPRATAEGTILTWSQGRQLARSAARAAPQGPGDPRIRRRLRERARAEGTSV